MEVSSVGKVLVVVGLLVVGLGALLVVGGGLGLGRLPGDFSFGRGNFKVFFPLATCLVLSIVATIVLNLFRR